MFVPPVYEQKQAVNYKTGYEKTVIRWTAKARGRGKSTKPKLARHVDKVKFEAKPIYKSFPMIRQRVFNGKRFCARPMKQMKDDKSFKKVIYAIDGECPTG